MLATLDGIGLHTVLLLLVAGVLAGAVDAIVGGGGLIQVPAMLLVPGFTPVHALATNKVAGVMGTITSTVTYARRLHPKWREIAPAAAVAFMCAFAGAATATRLSAVVLKPMILVVLVGVLVFTLLRPSLGVTAVVGELPLRSVIVRSLATGAVIGFYDGLLGPGTGSFLVIAYVVWMHRQFLDATMATKVVNCATNLGALALFIPIGAVHWGLGIAVGLANMAGGYLGSRLAMHWGSGFIRWVLVVVVSALVMKLGWDTAVQFGWV